VRKLGSVAIVDAHYHERRFRASHNTTAACVLGVDIAEEVATAVKVEIYGQ
jgi:hypothetical protein